MSRGTLALIGLAVAGSITTLFAIATFDWLAWTCRLPNPTSEPSRPFVLGPGGCFEFWLYRYQTLLSAFVAVFAAGLAWVAVQKQVEVARNQVSVAIGDIEPDFLLQGQPAAPYCGVSSLLLMVKNNHRHAVQVKSVTVLTPGFDITHVEYRLEPGTLRPLLTQRSGNRYDFEIAIDGTKPAAPEVNQADIFMRTKISNENAVWSSNFRIENCRVSVKYMVLGRDIVARDIFLECDIRFNIAD